MRLFLVSAIALSICAVACAANVDDDNAELGVAEQAFKVYSGVGGPCGTSAYACNPGLLCGTDCSSGSNRCYKCYDPNPPTCSAGQVLSNGVCVPASGGGSGACQVTFAFALYANVSQTVFLPLSESDCGGLKTSNNTPRSLPSAAGTGTIELTTAQDYGTGGLLINGTTTALSAAGASTVLVARDSFVTTANINMTPGITDYLTVKSVYAP